MKVTESSLNEKIVETFESPIGNLYVFDNLVITETIDSIHVDCEKSKVLLEPILKNFGKNKPFGFISNRINNYSTEALDLGKINSNLPNLISFSSVIYSYMGEMNLALEKQFCKIPYFGFNNINEAYNYVNDYILNKSTKIA